MDHFYAMIMAGGGGTRLWPMSRNDTPKQLLPLVEDQSMFRVSVERLAPLFTPDRIYVVTGKKYAEALQRDVPEIPLDNFIIEPYGKNSGPAALLGMCIIHQRDPHATVAHLTSDHHIAHKDSFRRALAGAYDLAQQGKIVTLGISPSFPSTAFGYIQRGDELGLVQGFRAYTALGFTEKPDLPTAIQFVTSGDYSWNSGMFIWTTKTAMDEFERQQPRMVQTLAPAVRRIGEPGFQATLAEVWDGIESIPIDYAVMEGADEMAVIPVDIGWSDIGSWDALYGVLPLDATGNGFKGQAPKPIMIDTTDTLVYSDRLAVTIGLENIVVVDTPDALMICHKSRAQDVREVVRQLKESGQTDYL